MVGEGMNMVEGRKGMEVGIRVRVLGRAWARDRNQGNLGRRTGTGIKGQPINLRKHTIIIDQSIIKISCKKVDFMEICYYSIININWGCLVNSVTRLGIVLPTFLLLGELWNWGYWN